MNEIYRPPRDPILAQCTTEGRRVKKWPSAYLAAVFIFATLPYVERRFFTVQEANELIPFLSERLRELRLMHEKLRVWSSSNPEAQEITLRGGTPVPPSYLGVVTRLQNVISDICAEGCHLKDVESGLVDFPTIWEGREVYLCWKLGEAEVGHWHDIEAGFAGRQSLSCKPGT